MKVSEIRRDGGTQARVGLNIEAIADYSAAMLRGDKFPPVVVFYDGTDYWMADGFHRAAAAEQAGIQEIEADVRSGIRRDAWLFAMKSNDKHGLRPTNADKRHKVIMALEEDEFYELPNTKIAEMCSVDEGLVRKIKKELDSDSPSTFQNPANFKENKIANFRNRAEEAERTAADLRNEIERLKAEKTTPHEEGEEDYREEYDEDDYDDDEDKPINDEHDGIVAKVLREELYAQMEAGAHADYDAFMKAIENVDMFKAKNHGDESNQEPEKAKPHVANNGGNNEWYTPQEYIDAARAVMGDIDLDPASCEIANRVVQAKEYYTAEDNGLEQEWAGRVWMNPPYAGDLIPLFCDKLKEHVVSGDIEQSIVLVNNATETAWFNTLISVASAVVFPKTRVKFYMPDGKIGAPLQGQAIIYIGSNSQAFMEIFRPFGWGAFI